MNTPSVLAALTQRDAERVSYRTQVLEATLILPSGGINMDACGAASIRAAVAMFHRMMLILCLQEKSVFSFSCQVVCFTDLGSSLP